MADGLIEFGDASAGRHNLLSLEELSNVTCESVLLWLSIENGGEVKTQLTQLFHQGIITRFVRGYTPGCS